MQRSKSISSGSTNAGARISMAHTTPASTAARDLAESFALL